MIPAMIHHYELAVTAVIIFSNPRHQWRVQCKASSHAAFGTSSGHFVTGNNGFWKPFFHDLCSNSSLHGFIHLTNPNRHVTERILWTLLLLSAIIGTIITSWRVWLLYVNSGTETVIETTNYKYGYDPFPAVIICDSSRVHWPRVLQLNYSDYSSEADIEEAIQALLKPFAIMSFGDFDEFDRFKEFNETLRSIDLNITDLLFKVMRPCEEVFTGSCLWRKQKFDCCQIFELQKTEFGLCYSFNSDVSEWSKTRSRKKDLKGLFWMDERTGSVRPRRTATYGKFSGLHVTINTPLEREMPPGVADAKPGVKVIIAHPEGFTFGREIKVSAGNFAEIKIGGDRLYSTERMRGMEVARRKCLFKEDAQMLGLPYYMRINCKTECFRNYTFNYCKCSPNFMFFDLDNDKPTYPNCDYKGLLCLNKNNILFNSYKPAAEIPYFKDNQTGMTCDCLSDCNHQIYKAEVNIVGLSNSTDDVELDIFFGQSSCILYRSDMIFGWLDLIVSFGGTIGLFLGGSLLSGAELIYYATLRLYHHFIQTRSESNKPRSNHIDLEAKPQHMYKTESDISALHSKLK